MAGCSISEPSSRRAVTLAVAMGLAALLWTGLVMGGWTAEWDRALMRDAGSLRTAHPWLIDPMWLVTRMGDGESRVLAVLLVGVGLWRAGAGAKALWLLLMVGSGLLLSPLCKLLIDRPRPGVLVHLDVVSNASYPSGHAMGAAILALSLGFLFRGLPVRTILAAYVLLVALSRLILGVHWPSDIVGGLLIGAFWTLAGFALWQRSSSRTNSATSRSER